MVIGYTEELRDSVWSEAYVPAWVWHMSRIQYSDGIYDKLPNLIILLLAAKSHKNVLERTPTGLKLFKPTM